MNTALKLKTCSVCGRDLPVSEFHRRRHYVHSGYRAACKSCTSEASRVARIGRIRTDEERQKHRIRALTHRAVQRGELTPLPCRDCGSLEIEAHHVDYVSPDSHLNVVWLCRQHHCMEHGKRAWTRQMELMFSM